jgi:hypothetical protein
MSERKTALEQKMLTSTGQFDCESVRRADLSASALVSLVGIGKFTSLEAVRVDDNKASGSTCTGIVHNQPY